MIGACEPPLEAKFYKVNKDSANKDRWFYRCPKPRQEKQCAFFLFDDEAQVLEKKALDTMSVSSTPIAGNNPAANATPVPANTLRPSMFADVRAETPRSEAPSTVGSGPAFSRAGSIFSMPATRGRRSIFGGIFGEAPPVPTTSWSSDEEDSDDTAANTPRFGRSPATTTITTPANRKRTRAGADADAGATRHRRTGTADQWDLDSDDTTQLVELADQTERIHQSQRSQRSQLSVTDAGGSSSSPTTPTAGRGSADTHMYMGLGGLPTPESRTSFAAAAASSSSPNPKRLKTTQGVPVTPTPTRTRSALVTAAGLPQQGGGGVGGGDCHCDEDDAEITAAVLGLLQAEPVSAAVRRAVRETLNMHALRGRGVERARDVLREGGRTKDRRIGELQARVGELEGRWRERRERLREVAGGLERLSQEEVGAGEED